MSLQVWLPLNGNLDNQGLSNVVVTNYGATVDNNGKIGKCYSLDGTDDRINISNLPNPQNISVSFWMKRNATTNSRQFMFTAWGGVTCELTTSNTIHCYVNGGNGACDSPNAITPDNGWIHLTYTFEDCVGGKLYINGQLIRSTASSGSISWTTTSGNIGNYSNMYYNGCINDFRIYDHVLSSKEVEEISKGLILHYKLDEGCFGNPNILLNTSFSSLYNQTTGWDTTKNGTVLANSWGGYNSGVGNASTVYHAHLKQFNGEYVYEYIRTADESWLGISQGGLQSKLTAGKTYTFSWEQYCVNGVNHVGTGLYYFKTEATSANFHLGIQQGSANKKMGEWQKFTYTFIAPSDADYTKSMSWYIYGHYGGQGTMYVRRPKLEEGSVATEWMPALSENPLNNNMIYDSSGYNNNGEIINDLQIISASPRYSMATNLTTTSSHIHVSNLSVGGFSNSYTFTWWGNCSTYSGKMMWGFSDGARLNGIYNGNLWNTGDGSNNPLYTPGTTTQVSAPSVNVWHHFAMVGNGTQCLVYLDGILWGQAKTYKTISGTSIYFNGWDSGTSYTLANTKISDFRMYSTALTAEQVKELYNTSASVDSNGNIYAREVVE